MDLQVSTKVPDNREVSPEHLGSALYALLPGA